MKQRFITKRLRYEEYCTNVIKNDDPKPVAPVKPVPKKNNKEEKIVENMDIDQIEKLAGELTPEQTTKKIKKDKGLIERTESSKIMITEDNKQLLKD